TLFRSSGGSGNFTSTLTITTSGSTPANSYDFTVTATGCGGVGNQNGSSNYQAVLVVTDPTCTQPVIDPIVDITTNNTPGQCSATVNYSVSSTGTPTYTYSFTGATSASGSGTGSGSTFNVGVTTVEITATNSCGSDMETFTVTVEDNVDPVAIAQDITVLLYASGNVSITPADRDNGSYDACAM